MTDVIRWLFGFEVLSLLFLPLTFAALSRLRDGGYPFAKVLGLLAVTYVTWLVGSFAPVARSALLPALTALAAAAAGWWFWHADAVQRVRDCWKVLALEEALFLASFVSWALLRVHVFGAGANHTEQFMDMALLNASYHSASFPAYDPWMSGHGINYYYFGYLLWGTFTKLVGVAPTLAFNLANVSLVALVVTCGYSLGFSLTGSRVWAGLAPLFLALVGNLHAALWGIWHGLCGQPNAGFFYTYYWPSTRVIGSGYTLGNWSCGVSPGSNPPAIDEYPMFSFILGDLHPHVMALPLVLLSIALAASYLLGGGPRLVQRDVASICHLGMLSVAVGALFVTNSWDFPTYFLVISGAVLARGYIEDPGLRWWRDPVLAIILLGVLSVAFYLPFYVHFRTLSAGIGLVTDSADLFEFFQMFGLFLAGSLLLVGSLYILLQPEPEEALSLDPLSEAGKAKTEAADRLLVLAAGAAVLIAASVAHRLTLVCLLGLALACLTVAYRVLNTEEPNRADAMALILAAIGCLAAAIPEVVYLRDAFAGSADYRMNTIFKFYYQAWILLGLAGAYGAYRSWRVLHSIAGRSWAVGALAMVACLTLGAGIYTAWIPSAGVNAASPASLDAGSWIAATYPGDARAIRWLNTNASPQQTLVEAVGVDYQTNGTVISTFTGLPAVMGWGGHEDQWRPNDPEVQQRITDVKTIYSTRDAGMARRLLQKYGVKYVVVGEAETAKYGANSAGLQKFGSFMRIAFSASGATIYTW